MARRFIDDIKADVNAQIIANAAGLITADVLRPLLLDTLDSTKDDEAILSNNNAQVGAVIPATWGDVVFTDSKGGDLNFLIVDLPTNKVTGTVTAGFSYKVQGFMTLSAATNVVIELAIGVNGVPLGYLGAFTGRGVGRPGSANCGYFETSLPPSTEFELLAQTVGGGTADISSAALTVTVKPTNNP